MNRHLFYILAIVLLFCSTPPFFVSAQVTEPTVQCQYVAIPAYFYPSYPPAATDYWGIVNSTLKSGEIVIVNPNSGSGLTKSSSYDQMIMSTKAKGIVNLGYVYTSYGLRSLTSVKLEIDNYFNWYGVNSIFLDETPYQVSTDQWQLTYYKDIFTYIKNRGGRVMLNPGMVPDERYLTVADQIVIFESGYLKYISASFPAWIANYPASRFVHLVYNTPVTSLSNTIALSKQRNAGYIFITNDDILPDGNPWNTLPNYWLDEISQKCLNIPIPTSTPTPTIAPTAIPTLKPTLIPTLAPTIVPTIKPIDITAPIVTINNPKSGSTVNRNSKISIVSSATDNVRVTKLEYYVNNVLKCRYTTVKSCNWVVPSTRNVSYTIQVKAYDAAKNMGTQSIIVRSSR